MRRIAIWFWLFGSAGVAHAQFNTLDNPQTSVAPRALDSGITNSLGWLFNDDPQYYSRAPIWVPLAKITVSNAALWAIDRYIFNYDFSHISLNSWSENLKR